MQFQECATCAAKLGHPTLCPSCLQNRAAITALQLKLAGLSAVIEFVEHDQGIGLLRQALPYLKAQKSGFDALWFADAPRKASEDIERLVNGIETILQADPIRVSRSVT